MEEDGAAAQHQLGIAVLGQPALGRLRDMVEEGRAARGEHQRRVRRQRAHCLERAGGALHQRGDIAGGERRVRAGDGAFVGGHARQRELVALLADRGQDGRDRGIVARARAAAADFHQHLHGPAGFSGRGGQRTHGVGGVRERQQARVGVACKQLAQAGAAGRAADLVTQHQAGYAGAQQHGGLLQVGDGGAPGACVEQALHDLRRHRRLGMRRQRRAVAAGVLEDLLDVVGEGGLIQRQDGQGHVAAPGLPAPGCDAAQRDGGFARRNAPVGVVQWSIEQGFQEGIHAAAEEGIQGYDNVII